MTVTIAILLAIAATVIMVAGVRGLSLADVGALLKGGLGG